MRADVLANVDRVLGHPTGHTRPEILRALHSLRAVVFEAERLAEVVEEMVEANGEERAVSRTR